MFACCVCVLREASVERPFSVWSDNFLVPSSTEEVEGLNYPIAVVPRDTFLKLSHCDLLESDGGWIRT